MKIARLLFDKMFVKDFTAWSIMISRYVKNGQAGNTWGVSDNMRRVGVVGDGTTMLTLLSPFDDLMDLKLREAFHGYVSRNIGKL